MIESAPGNFGSSKVPYDWYQNLTHVIITVRIANLKENDVKVTIINDALDVMCQLLDGRQFRMHFNLFRNVQVPESNWAVDTSKLVINLRKLDRKRWHSLEMIPDKQGVKPKTFVGIVSLRDTKSELSTLLSAAESESKNGNNSAITITQTRAPGDLPSSEPMSLDYNWHQSDDYINLVIHVPVIKMPDNREFLFYEDDINIILTDNTLNWICNFPTGVTNVNFKLNREINSNDSRYEISSCRTKIEIKLRKLDKTHWPSFVINNDGQTDPSSAQPPITASDETPDQIQSTGVKRKLEPEVVTLDEDESETAVNGVKEVDQVTFAKKSAPSAICDPNEVHHQQLSFASNNIVVPIIDENEFKDLAATEPVQVETS